MSQSSPQEIIIMRSTCVAGKALKVNEICWDERVVGFLWLLMNSSCIFPGCCMLLNVNPRNWRPYLLIGCSLLLSISGLGGGAEKVLKLRDRGRGEGRLACLLLSPSSIWTYNNNGIKVCTAAEMSTKKSRAKRGDHIFHGGEKCLPFWRDHDPPALP